MPDIKIQIKNINKKYKVQNKFVTALENISFDIYKEEFLCIVGASGCGKSTLLNIIAGLDFPTSGDIYLNNNTISGPGPDRVVIFQESALFPWLTVLENIEFGLKLQKISQKVIKEKALLALEQVQLINFKNSYVHQLSGGMKQKVAIARGLVLDPDVLLMDEPFSALDPQSRDLLHEELYKIWFNTKKTILFVTHNIEEAVLLGCRVILLSKHPGTVHKIYPVDFTRPRFAKDPKINDYSNYISSELKKISFKNYDHGAHL